jgi:predicted O-methyltransferase YrrM
LITQDLIQLIQTEEAQEFLSHHKEYDSNKLLLKYAKKADFKALATQLALRKKLNKKLPEWSKNLKVLFPLGVSPEQASSEATAKLKASLVSGKALLDITGGMGVDSYYFSKSFSQVIYTERQEELSALSKHNFNVLGSENITVLHSDGVAQLSAQTADWIYIDPARRGSGNAKLVSLSDCEPDVTDLLNELLKERRKVLIKTSPLLDITKAIEQLKFVEEVWIISHKNDCKELVFLLNKEFTGPVKARTYNIESQNSTQEFSFYLRQSEKAELAEEVGSFVYEPNASILKAAGGDLLARALKIQKLDRNTNIFTSNERVKNFPGKTFKLEGVVKPYHTSLKKGRFNVISRNYPDKASIIESKLKLKSSNSHYLIACKAAFANYLFIIGRQIKDI